MADRNQSESFFEQYLVAHGLTEFSYEPEEPGKAKRPDYRLTASDGQILYFDVKEFEQSEPLMPVSGAYDFYGPIREKINAVRTQFKEHACALVLFNPGVPLIDIESSDFVFGAMLGNLGIQWQVPADPRTDIPPPQNYLARAAR